MDALQALMLRQDVMELVLQAAACVDANDAAGLAALFAEDGVLVRPGGQPLRGRDAIRDAYAQRPAERMTRHVVTNLRVEAEAPDRARARSVVLLWTGSRADAAGPYGRPAQRQVLGEFDDRLVLTAEGWRIAQREACFVLDGGAGAGAA